MQYLLLNITAAFGLLIGLLVSFLANDERIASKKYLRFFVIPIPQYVVCAVLGIIFAISSMTNYFFLVISLIFLYSIPTGSFLFVNKKTKELIFAFAAFVASSIIINLFTTFLF